MREDRKRKDRVVRKIEGQRVGRQNEGRTSCLRTLRKSKENSLTTENQISINSNQYLTKWTGLTNVPRQILMLTGNFS